VNSSAVVGTSTNSDRVFLFNWQGIDSNEFLSRNLSTLSDHEASRVGLIQKRELKQRFAISRIILRSQLGLVLDQEPSQLQIGRDNFGKPFLTKFPNLYFSLSHSQSMIAIMISKRHQIGLDVEYIYRKNRIADIAKGHFSAEEFDYLQLKNIDRSEFFTLWTLKEAYVKALGKGLTKSLNSFRFEFNRRFEVFDIDRKVGASTFFAFKLSDGFVLACCALKDNGDAPVFFHLDERMKRKMCIPELITR
jgi:phosphopantetheinyl transferase